MAVWEKRGKDAKHVIEKINQQIIMDSELDKHPRYCNRSQIMRKIVRGGIKLCIGK